jgi:hypothetical protein
VKHACKSTEKTAGRPCRLVSCWAPCNSGALREPRRAALPPVIVMWACAGQGQATLTQGEWGSPPRQSPPYFREERGVRGHYPLLLDRGRAPPRLSLEERKGRGGCEGLRKLALVMGEGNLLDDRLSARAVPEVVGARRAQRKSHKPPHRPHPYPHASGSAPHCVLSFSTVPPASPADRGRWTLPLANRR